MAGSVGGEGFWLPSEFLTDDDFLMGKENLNKTNNNNEMEPEFCFPTEFTYDFGILGKRPLEKLRATSTSPQSTLARMGSWRDGCAGGSSNGSPNGVKSPQNVQYFAKYDAVEDLIYRAADQFAKLKLNHGDVLGPEPTRLLGSARTHGQYYPAAKNLVPSVLPNRHFQQKQQNEGCEVWYNQERVHQNRGGRALGGTRQAAWPVQQNPAQRRAVSSGGCGGGGGGGGGGAAVKRASAGTGVFLPRRYGNNNDNNGFPSDYHMKIGSSTALFPGRATAQSHIKNFNNMNGFAQSQPQQQSQPRINRALVPDYNSLLLRRHTLVLQERRRLLTSLLEGSSMMGHDLCLPHEWTY